MRRTASAQSTPSFPVYGTDKWLGNVNELTRPLFTQYFNQVTPENAGKWGSAAGTTRTAAMRWGNLDTAYDFAQANNMKFNFHVLVWGNQQPTWMAALPAEEQLVEIKKWFAAVAERYPKIDWLQVVNEPLHDPPDCTHSANQGNNCNASGNYARALGGANGTDGTGWDWILNAFRLAKQYFPNTKLMLNDYSITNSDSATTQYLQIINILKRENLIDVVGEQGHAFSTTGNMAQHKANLDRLAATGRASCRSPSSTSTASRPAACPATRCSCATYRRIVPMFWEHPSVEGVTVWGWRQPNHWRNAQNAPIVLSDDTPEARRAVAATTTCAASRRPSRPASGSTLDDVNAPVGAVQAEDWASRINRPNLRTFTWRITGGNDAGLFAIAPATGALSVAKPQLLDELTTYTLKVRVSDGFHESAETEVAVVTGDLANVVDGAAGGTVPATLSLTLGAPASFGAFTPGVAQDYTASSTATVTSTAGDAALTASATTLANGAFRLAQPVTITPAKTSWTRSREQRHVRDRVQAGDRPHGGAAHRRLQRDRDLHAVDHDAVMKLRMTALALVASAVAAAPAAAQDLVAHYPFDETSGTVVNDRSGGERHAAIVNGNAATVWNAGRGLTLPGGNGGTAPAVRLPDGLLAGLDDVTITYDLRLSSTTQGPVFAFGRTADNGGSLTATPGSGTTPHQASIAGPGASAAVQTAAAPVSLLANTWIHVAVTVKGGDVSAPGQLRLYEDGELMTSNDALTVKPPGHHVRRRLRRSLEHRGGTAVPGTDQGPPGLLEGADHRAGAGVVGRRGARQPGRARGLDRPRRHERDHAQPHACRRVPGVTWSTSDPSVVTAQGEIIRPAVGQGDATATLKATFTHRGLTDTRSFPVTVKQRVAIPADQLRTGLAALLQARRDERHHAGRLRHGRRGRDAREPGQGHAHRRRRHAQPRRLRRLTGGRVREAARRRHGRA